MSDEPIDSTRRKFLERTIALGASGLLANHAKLAIGQHPNAKGYQMIVRNTRPLDLETPVEAFESQITSNRLFFVRSHFGVPAIELTDLWKVSIQGGVKSPLALSLDELNKLEQVTVAAVLQCAGNGRGLFTPTIPGIGWTKGAVGNAEWTGVRLADLLNRAGIEPDMAHVQLVGADGPPMPKTPAFLRSIPLNQALLQSVLLATTMNGEPLPKEHGGPVRLVVPGWTGNHWMKWLRTIVVSKNEAPGFYQQTGYKMPLKPTPPGVDLKPNEVTSVTRMNVKSLIARPLEGAKLSKGRHEIQGVAWTGGDDTITKVEVAIGETWNEARLLGESKPYEWRRWSYAFDVNATGPLKIQARATDSTGATQPESSPWNKSGYLWNGYDHIICEAV
jgi:DMSO/TMAO reductase YedYZ molybdopterin-dependent catalytic subunit